MTTGTSPPARLNPGKLAVVGLLTAGLLAASFAWWWNYNRGRRALDLYGAPAARLIRTAPVVELLSTESGVTPPQATDGRGAVRTTDISRAAGLLHARTSLLQDASYDWDAPASPGTSESVVLQFSDGRATAAMYLYVDEGIITAASSGRSARLVSKTAAGWRTFLLRNIDEQAK
jgi:hypothetical protein